MSVRVSTRLVLLIAAGAVGCGQNPQPKFAFHERTQGLLPAARRAVQDEVIDKFGAPTRMVAWERMPVNFGGLAGRIDGVAEGRQHDEGIQRLLVRFDEEAAVLAPGQELLFLSGAYVDQTATIAAFDSDGGVLELREALAEPPGEGDRFVVHFGELVNRGRKLYAEHCMHCHGTSGDGNGPTAPYLNPPPRDYRQGLFKFKSTSRSDRPNRDDLEHIIREGIPGTYMPSFLLLTDDEMEAIVEYVRWLAMRGEYEHQLTSIFAADYSEAAVEQEHRTRQDQYRGELARWEESGAGDRPQEPTLRQIRGEFDERLKQELERFDEEADELADFIAADWQNAESEESVVRPAVGRRITADADPELWHASLSNGRTLYLANCAVCHGPTGRGDGDQTREFQDIPGTIPVRKYPDPGLHDEWGHKNPPRDLTRGIYRGGRRPIDLYRRVHEGITGTQMPPFKGKLQDDDIWDVVNYVMHIPYDKDHYKIPIDEARAQPVAAAGGT